MHGKISGGYALILVKAPNPESAFDALGPILHNWYLEAADGEEVEINALKPYAEAVEAAPDDEMRSLVTQAQEKGHSVALIGVPAPGKEDELPFGVPIKLGPDPGHPFRSSRRLNKRGCCLHFDAGPSCTQIIRAHSIGKSNHLRPISTDGMVYVLSGEIPVLRETGGSPRLKLRGISQASIFRGMCGKHDNDTFDTIDGTCFDGGDIHACLYAYRSICREVYVKRNAYDQLEDMLSQLGLSRSGREFLELGHHGQGQGLLELENHKKRFEELLRRQDFSRIRSCLLRCEGAFPLAVASCFYPLWDFNGVQIQDLAESPPWDLITFSTVNTESGAGLLFVWHEDSEVSCNKLIGSLRAIANSGRSFELLMLRFLLGSSENIALAPAWVDSLTDAQRRSIEGHFGRTLRFVDDIERNTTLFGLEDLSPLNFKLQFD